MPIVDPQTCMQKYPVGPRVYSVCSEPASVPYVVALMKGLRIDPFAYRTPNQRPKYLPEPLSVSLLFVFEH